MPTVTSHEKALRDLPCAVSRRRPVTLHHCHGGSIKDLRWHVGMGQRQNPFLQIPLHADFHVGQHGIDSGMGVQTWEWTYGTQVALLNWVSEQLGYDVFKFAKVWEEGNRAKSRRLEAEGDSVR